jgi:hypothetical protein
MKLVIKASGEQEPFNVGKFQQSLRKAGADEELIRVLTQQVMHDAGLQTTRDIYAFALSHLSHAAPPVAVRYNLKSALTELGPSGFPFEHFVAELFKQLGYSTAVGQVLQGTCVSHEVDVVISKDGTRDIIECKFHQAHIRANVKVPLYIKARFDDIRNADAKVTAAWCVTNTKFTSQAITYGQCAQLHMLSWSYPEKDNLASIIDRLGLHPITALTSLNNAQKKELILDGVVLCKDIGKRRKALERLGIPEVKINAIIHEAQTACELGRTT